MNHRTARVSSFIEQGLPWLTFLILFLYTHAFFSRVPYAGFTYARDGTITEVFATKSNGDLAVNDILLQVGNVTWQTFQTNPNQVLFEGLVPRENVPIRIFRAGHGELLVTWQLPGAASTEIVQRLNSQWWLPFIFWFTGLATFLQIRPKNIVWRLLVSFNFLTALWLAAGTVSSSHVWHSVFVFHSAIWLSLPTYLLLHLSFPHALVRLPNWLRVLGFLVAIVMVSLEWFQLLPSEAYVAAFSLAILGSLLLLIAQFVRTQQRRVIGLLMGAMAFSLLPIFASLAVRQLSIPPVFEGGSLLALPAIPGAYFFAASHMRLEPSLKRRANRLVSVYVVGVLCLSLIILVLARVVDWTHLQTTTLVWGIPISIIAIIVSLFGIAPVLALTSLSGAYAQPTIAESSRLEVVANRIFIPYLFIILLSVVIFILVLFASNWLMIPGETLFVSLVGVLVMGIATQLLYSPFKRYVETYLFGLPEIPTAQLESFTNQLVGLQDKESLLDLLKEQVLQTFQIRQSAFFWLDTLGTMQLAYVRGELDEKFDVNKMELGQRWQPAQGLLSFPKWAQFVLPLRHQKQVVGYWLLGHREPDNIYARRELDVLQAMANQVGIAISGFNQAGKLRALYEANIDRHEQERLRLARELHDETLSQLGALTMFVQEEAATPEFYKLHGDIINQLRAIIANLRPKMLDFGLWSGLSQLVDELSERNSNQSELLFDVPKTDIRYPERVEQNAYRIVQQALDNACQHANAELIHVYGSLQQDRIHLIIEDNGDGFSLESENLAELLEEQRYGLAGMYERATLIKAKLHIDSVPNRTTVVTLLWNGQATL